MMNILLMFNIQIIKLRHQVDDIGPTSYLTATDLVHKHEISFIFKNVLNVRASMYHTLKE